MDSWLPHGRFPQARPRRLRHNPLLRAMVRQTRLGVEDLIEPIFLRPGQKIKNPVASMPGVFQVSPDIAVEKLAEAAHNPKNHRYSASRGIPNLRVAMATRYKNVFGVDLDPDTEVVTTIGAKEGLTHLMWVLLGPGDTAIVPSPSYPIHLAGPGFAGASVVTVPMHDPASSALEPGDDFFEGLLTAWNAATVKPRVIICSFPHNPTSACVDLAFMERLVQFALERDVIICHDFAYADLGFDGYQPPSILQVPRAKECCVELYTLTKSFSMAGWRVGFLVGNKEVVAALTKLKSYLDYGTFQPIQIASIVAMNEAPDYPDHLRTIYTSRRDTLIDGLQRIGWNVAPPKGSIRICFSMARPVTRCRSIC